MGKRSKRQSSDTQLILDVMGLGAVFAVTDLMITSAHSRGSSFLQSVDRQRQFAPLDIATLTTSVNDILGNNDPVNGDTPTGGRLSELEKIIRRQETLIREQEKIIGEIATGRPAVT